MPALGRFTDGADVLLEMRPLGPPHSCRELTTNGKNTTQIFQ